MMGGGSGVRHAARAGSRRAARYVFRRYVFRPCGSGQRRIAPPRSLRPYSVIGCGGIPVGCASRRTRPACPVPRNR